MKTSKPETEETNSDTVALRELGRLIGERLAAKGVTERKLAQLAGVSRSNIRFAKQGANVTVLTLVKLARALDIRSVAIGSLTLTSAEIPQALAAAREFEKAATHLQAAARILRELTGDSAEANQPQEETARTFAALVRDVAANAKVLGADGLKRSGRDVARIARQRQGDIGRNRGGKTAPTRVASNEMSDAVHDQARLLAAWLATRDPDMERIAIRMGGVPEPEWEAIVASLPAPFEAEAVDRVICRAHELLGRAPTEAQSLARLALRMTRRLNAKTCSDLALIEGDAWRECAAAHLEMAEFDDAYQAVGRARLCYERSPSSRINAAVLLLIEARTLFELGRWSEALATVDLGSRELLDSGADRKKRLHAMIMRANILIGMGQPGAALDVFPAAADLATQSGDNETLAYVLSNTGLCAAKLGDTTHAEQCFESALQLFNDMGLTSDMQTVRTAMVSILKVKGRLNEAISALFEVRAEFLSLGIPVKAAISSLEIVELMLVCGRYAEVPQLCSEMVRTFTKARLQKNLLKALAYLDEVARRRGLTESDVNYVSAFFERAQDDPKHAFTVPA